MSIGRQAFTGRKPRSVARTPNLIDSYANSTPSITCLHEVEHVVTQSLLFVCMVFLSNFIVLSSL